jgi:hypothetical protein
MRLRLISLVLFGITLSAPLAMAGNIFVNPGFESGLLGWTVVNDPDQQVIMLNTNSHSGSLDIESQCVGAVCLTSSGQSFFQDLPTVIGTTYNLSFWAFFDGFAAGQPDELKITWGGITAFDIVDPAVPDMVYAGYGAPNLLATTSTTRLQFFGRQDIGQSLGVDDIAVVVSPEPSTLLLLGVALLIAAGAGYRRRHLILSGTPAVATAKCYSK